MDEEMNESFEEFEDDFDPEADADIGEDLDIEDLASDDFESSDDEKSNDNYSDAQVASAIQANPKRQQARKKNKLLIDGLTERDLAKPDGQKKAWDMLNSKANTNFKKTYVVGMELRQNDLLEHPRFGLGFVVDELSTTKVMVLFEDGVKKLVCKNPVAAD